MMFIFIMLALQETAIATGAHQHIMAFPLANYGANMAKPYLPIWPMFEKKGIIYELTNKIGPHLTIVAKSTRTQYDYELYVATSSDEDYDPEFFWSSKLREWIYLGEYALMTIFAAVGIGYAGTPWIELQQYYNGFEEEPFYGGMNVHIRTWKDCCTWWAIQTMHFGYYTMWTKWQDLYLPWEHIDQNYSSWTSWQTDMPSIPDYNPHNPIKKIKMIFGNDISPYRLLIQSLWTNVQRPSDLSPL